MIIANRFNNILTIIKYSGSSNNTITTLSTTGNGSSGVGSSYGSQNYLYNATINESTPVSGATPFARDRVYVSNYQKTANNYYIYTDGGIITSSTAHLT